jgi:SAM-dependent methyltransferase
VFARLAWDAAPHECLKAGLRCEAYHRVRPLLRRLGLAAEPEDQRAFLFPALVAALTQAGPRILISGSVDEAMASMVVEAGSVVGCAPSIVVVDRCMTPLLVNQAFAQSAGADLSIVQADILSFRAPHQFDVVATHSLFGSIGPNDRSRLITTWADSLRPGGRVITVARLRPASEARSFASEAPARLAAEVRRRAAEHAQEIGIAADALTEAVLRYTRERAVSFPVGSLAELVGLFAGNGFRVLQAETEDMPGRIRGIEGPGLPRGGLYAEVVAERV